MLAQSAAVGIPASSAAAARTREDAHRALVGGPLQSQGDAQRFVVAAGEDRDRASVRDVRHHRSQSDKSRDVFTQSDIDELRSERLPGASRFHTTQQPQPCSARAHGRTPQGGIGPRDAALTFEVCVDMRARVLIVEVQFRIDAVDGLIGGAPAQLRCGRGGSLTRVVPAVEGDDEHLPSQCVHAAPFAVSVAPTIRRAEPPRHSAAPGL